MEKYLGQYLNFQRDSFAALNTAFIEDGVYVHVSKDTLAGRRSTFFTSLRRVHACMDHPRNLIVVDENSEATVVEDYVSARRWSRVLQCCD